tara:strand:- start:111165 stop:111410 length:246 start_codon:yes stop_codon:yes gene_type:complete
LGWPDCMRRNAGNGLGVRKGFHIQILQTNHRLCPVTHPQFTEDGGHVRLDGGFGHPQLVSNLFVQLPFRQHTQHPELLRGQ